MTANERVKEIRKSENLTLEKFGARLGVGKSVLSQIENGRSNVTEQMIKSICREFRVSEQWLRDGVGEMYSVPDDFDSVIDGIRAEPDDPAYAIALDVLRAYQALDDSSKSMLRGFAAQLLNDKKDRES